MEEENQGRRRRGKERGWRTSNQHTNHFVLFRQSLDKYVLTTIVPLLTKLILREEILPDLVFFVQFTDGVE